MRSVNTDSICIQQTISLCSYCQERVHASIVIKKNSVYIEKSCPTHGEQTELLEDDAGYYIRRMDYDKPGTNSKRQTTISEGCPFDCGLCPDHGQHTCIGLVEVTDQCELKCPVCYADSGGEKKLSIDNIDRMLDFFVESEGGHAEILQISGGEPTSHPEIIEIIRLARSKNIKHILLNTNGVRIADDEDFVKELSQFVGSFEIYLQFDGVEGKGGLAYNGNDLVAIKKRALELLAMYRIPITLVSKIERGINDKEIGAIIAYGMSNNYVRGINFQPVAYFGRYSSLAGIGRRITLTGIIHEIAKQMKGNIRTEDFVPLPCDAHRVAIAYMFRQEDGFMPFTRGLNAGNCIAHIQNTFRFDADDFIKDMAGRLISEDDCCGYPGLLDRIRRAIPSNYFLKSERDKVDYISGRTFRITVTSFLDAYNFDMASMKKECVHVITPDLKRIPFSAYNMLHRKKYKPRSDKVRG